MDPYFTRVDPYFTRVELYFTCVDPYFTRLDQYFTLWILILHCGSVIYTSGTYFTRVDPFFTLWIRILHAWIRGLQIVYPYHRSRGKARTFHPIKPGFKLRSVHLGCVVESVMLAQVFSEYSSFPCQRHSANAPHSPVHLSHKLCDINNFKHR